RLATIIQRLLRIANQMIDMANVTECHCLLSTMSQRTSQFQSLFEVLQGLTVVAPDHVHAADVIKRVGYAGRDVQLPKKGQALIEVFERRLQLAGIEIEQPHVIQGV